METVAGERKCKFIPFVFQWADVQKEIRKERVREELFLRRQRVAKLLQNVPTFHGIGQLNTAYLTNCPSIVFLIYPSVLSYFC